MYIYVYDDKYGRSKISKSQRVFFQQERLYLHYMV